MDRQSRRKTVLEFGFEGAEVPPDKVETLEVLVRSQIQRALQEYAGNASLTSVYALHRRRMLEPLHPKDADVNLEDFERWYRDVLHKFKVGRFTQKLARRRATRNYRVANTGYEEQEELPEADEPEFRFPHRAKSIIEDLWKAEYYERLHTMAHEQVPDRSGTPALQQSDRFSDVFAASFRENWKEQNRPVLTHELADFENPFMMKQSALERAYQELCVRDRLDERVLPRVLEKTASLTKLRSKAHLPPEAVEPVAAFRGDATWSFNASRRLAQKLDGARSALQAVRESKGGDIGTVLSTLPENADSEERPSQLGGLWHPWKNHLGFESEVPRGTAGGTRFGQPMKALDQQVLSTRYPTLQRVAHTLPKDSKWRAHVAQSIRVMERSKHWDFASKLRAVNSMKEIYDNMKDSDFYTQKLDEKLAINRVLPQHRRWARGVQYTKTFPKGFIKNKTFKLYRTTLTGKPWMGKKK